LFASRGNQLRTTGDSGLNISLNFVDLLRDGQHLLLKEGLVHHVNCDNLVGTTFDIFERFSNQLLILDIGSAPDGHVDRQIYLAADENTELFIERLGRGTQKVHYRHGPSRDEIRA